MISLLDVYECENAESFLYSVLMCRDSKDSISHKDMPSRAAHGEFVRSRPFRAWYVVRMMDSVNIGEISANDRNEVRLQFLPSFKSRHNVYQAISKLGAMLEPLPAIPSKRAARFCMNVSPTNTDMIAWMGSGIGPLLQYTFSL